MRDKEPVPAVEAGTDQEGVDDHAPADQIEQLGDQCEPERREHAQDAVPRRD